MSCGAIVVGAGPVGLTTALLLAKHGMRVTVFERRLEPSSEPRAVSLDDESLRIWQACGVESLLREDWASGLEGQRICTYLDGRDRPILALRQRMTELGHPHAVTIHQGRIDEKLLAAAARHPFITLRRGCSVVAISQSDDRVIVEARGSDGGRVESRAPWVVGCDGARSAVRELLGVAMVGHDVRHPWLVANVADRGEPGHVRIRCRTRGAAVTMPIPHGCRRVEVQLEEDDDGAWIGDERAVRERLRAGWEGSVDAPLLNVAICRFRAAIACRWREGRVFLAGDAAHVMPPFAGQGLGAGLRDAANLAFKIAGVSQRWLGPAALETYEVERRPHVERMIRLATRLGRVMVPRSRVEAAVTHLSLRILSAAPMLRGSWLLRGPRIQPSLRTGFLTPSRHAGRYLPQPIVLGREGCRVRLDEVLGPRMTWLVLASARGEVERIPSRLIQQSDSVVTEGRDFVDPSHALRHRYGAGSLVLIRPDRVVHTHLRRSHVELGFSRTPACRSEPTLPRPWLPAFVSRASRSSSPSRSRQAASPTARIRVS